MGRPNTEAVKKQGTDFCTHGAEKCIPSVVPAPVVKGATYITKICDIWAYNYVLSELNI
jgi:hypothetical protein